MLSFGDGTDRDRDDDLNAPDIQPAGGIVQHASYLFGEMRSAVHRMLGFVARRAFQVVSASPLGHYVRNRAADHIRDAGHAAAISIADRIRGGGSDAHSSLSPTDMSMTPDYSSMVRGMGAPTAAMDQTMPVAPSAASTQRVQPS